MKIIIFVSIIVFFLLGIATAQDVICPDNTSLKVQWFYEGTGDWFHGPYTYCCKSAKIERNSQYGKNILYCKAYLENRIGWVLLSPPYTILPLDGEE